MVGDGFVGDKGRSLLRNSGDDNGERLLCLCCAAGTSMKRDSSCKSVGFWNILANSSHRLETASSPADCASLLVRLVEGAMFDETPSRWAPQMIR